MLSQTGGNDTDLLSIEQLARVLDVSPHTVRVWRRDNIGPLGFRLGKHVRYHPEDVRAWIDAARAEGRGGPPVVEMAAEA